MRYIGLAAIVVLGVVAWRIAGSLSADALGMAVGILFGMSAGIPAALLVLVSARNNYSQDEADDSTWDAGYRAGLLESQRRAALDYDRPERERAFIVDAEPTTRLAVRR